MLCREDPVHRLHRVRLVDARGGAGAKVPVRWKQFLVTWSAIFPLVLGVPTLLAPLLRRLSIEGQLLSTLAVTGVVVFLMVSVVMSNYTN